jgi:DNA-binding transcriptional LysR family regulator
MDVRHLRSFVAVAEERHFARAAARLNMAQSPLSQQIRRMEAELGTVLFERTTRRVDLTPAGRALLPRAREVIEGMARALDDTRRAARGTVGRVSIGFTGSATFALLPAVATSMRARLPEVELRLTGAMLTPQQVSALLDRSIDFGILRPPVHRRELTVEILRREALVAVVPAGHRLAAAPSVHVADLAGEPFVVYVSHRRSVVHDAVQRTCEQHGFVPAPVIEVTESATLVSFVAAGAGVALVPESVCHMRVGGAVYRPLADSHEGVELGLAWRRGDDDPALARALEIVRSVAAAAPHRPIDRVDFGLDSDDRRA